VISHHQRTRQETITILSRLPCSGYTRLRLTTCSTSILSGSCSQISRLDRSSKCAKHDSLASVIAQLFLGFFQLEKYVCGADEDLCDMSVGTLEPFPSKPPNLTFELDHIAYRKLDITGVQQRHAGRLLFSPLYFELDSHVLTSGIDPEHSWILRRVKHISGTVWSFLSLVAVIAVVVDDYGTVVCERSRFAMPG
jgi:hypothetical protein